ncbi:MAG: response regulator, partial [Spirochaetia bacterium]
LGLPIVKRLAQLMDMQIRLRSIPGRGTCVTMAGLRISAERSKLPQRIVRYSQDSAGVGEVRVLLVEDDGAVLCATASLLTKWGCKVQAETSIPVAVAGCDLIITDFDLGDSITGSDCISAVRKMVGWNVPAVVMSGHDPGRVREDLANDDIPILSKPVRPVELRSIIMAAAVKAVGRKADA